jgi:hypothetical protein
MFKPGKHVQVGNRFDPSPTFTDRFFDLLPYQWIPIYRPQELVLDLFLWQGGKDSCKETDVSAIE